MMTDPAASRPGTHLDPDQMADLFDGLLDAGAADAARAHLATCPVCSSDFALITGEADFDGLGELLPPIPIPQDVMARVEAALYREPPLAPATAPASHIAQPPRRRRFRLAFGSLAGATLVIAGGIGAFAALNTSDDGANGSSNSAIAGGAASPVPGAENSRDDTKSPAMGSPEVVTPHASASSPRQNFNSMNIPGQAEALLGQHASTAANGTAQTAPDCLVGTVVAGTKPLASAPIEYEGKQAVLLVYPESGNTTTADVYVIASGSCTSGNSAQILQQTKVPRP